MFQKGNEDFEIIPYFRIYFEFVFYFFTYILFQLTRQSTDL